MKIKNDVMVRTKKCLLVILDLCQFRNLEKVYKCIAYSVGWTA